MSAEGLQRADRVGRGSGGRDGNPRPLLRLRAQLAVLGRGLAGSPEAGAVLLLSLAVGAVLLATAAAQVRLNSWNAPFYDAVEQRDVGRFMHQVAVFFAIAGTLLVLNVAQAWLSLTIQLKLRAGLVHDLFDLWLAPLRAFRLAHGDRLGVNPDQRLHEDTRHLSELSTSLAIGLVQASVMLAVFAVVLWRLSAGFAIAVLGHRFVVPGYMVWAAVAYALIGSLASYRVGYSLIRFNADRYNAEARLRAALVRVSDNIGTIALQRGEGSERRFLEGDLGRVLDAMRALVTATTRLTWVTAGYGWLTQVVPLLVAAPVYFSGQISFGELMMAVGAFNQVQGSLRWFVDNSGAIADWRATLLRVADFRRATLASEHPHDEAGHIVVEAGAPGRLTLDGLAVAAEGACTRLDEPQVVVEAGERVQITGDSGDAQTIVFRALAGLWPWGAGHIGLPGDEPFAHVARRPYIRDGRLRDVLAYPGDADGFDTERFAAALEKVGLAELTPRLDEDARWSQVLGEQDQQRLAFARLVLQRPAWIIIDQVLEALDDAAHEQVLALLRSELGAAAIINIGRPEQDDGLFSRSIGLVSADGPRIPVREDAGAKAFA